MVVELACEDFILKDIVWLPHVQYLGGAAIVSNCTLLIFMYDKGGKWSMDPGLAGVLVLEHALLAARFGLSWFVPEVSIYLIGWKHFVRLKVDGS